LGRFFCFNGLEIQESAREESALPGCLDCILVVRILQLNYSLLGPMSKPAGFRGLSKKLEAVLRFHRQAP
jgi:hypothetical protein